jgi:hypothetical protein
MAQGHRFKSEWPSEALSGARRPHSVDLAGSPSRRGMAAICAFLSKTDNGVALKSRSAAAAQDPQLPDRG